MRSTGSTASTKAKWARTERRSQETGLKGRIRWRSILSGRRRKRRGQFPNRPSRWRRMPIRSLTWSQSNRAIRIDPGKLFTIRGRHLMTINTTVKDLVTFGYSIQTKQMANAPAWFEEKYDIDGVPDVEGQPDIQQMRILIRDALVERFGLKFHNEQRELSVYALTVAKGGPKMTITSDKPSTPGNFIFGGLGKLRVTNSTMKDFCHGMQEAVMDKPVVDQTGLTERYDFNLNWTPDQSQFAAMGATFRRRNR